MPAHISVQDQLGARQQAVISIAAFTANGDMEKLNTALNDGLDAGLTVNEIKEILIQMYAYCGFPRSLNGLSCFMAVIESRNSMGIKDKEGPPATPRSLHWNSLQSGTENQTRLVGQPVSGALFEFAPTIDEYLKAHLFGDIFQRDVLDWQTRELATISALATMDGTNSQLKSHYAISLNTGITLGQLSVFVNVLEAKCGSSVAVNAKAVLGQFLTDKESQ